MYQEINSVVQSLKVIGDLLSAHKDLANYNELAAAVYEVNAKLMQATTVALSSQEKQASLSNRISELENKLAEVERFETKIQRYRLHEFPTGTLAYALNPGMENGEPEHYLCTACVDKRQISRMQPISGKYSLECHCCKLRIDIKERDHSARNFRVL
ncbi:hypothetical protein [uncultured Thiodictyon sp.]|uniref:hypothetical protein n=1 Tax=uncultured Thiodictyon sp. TaxID=1846217 RepID=UPI0025F732E6|nr:hypothetical protein [uncultured Thiodictyon sp.]